MRTTNTDPMDDARECERLEAVLLSPAQLRYLNYEQRPRWNLNPPQREEYASPRDYVLALAAYADRALDAEAQELHEDSYWDDPLRGNLKC